MSIAAACTQNMLELMFSPSFFLIGICEDTLVPEGEPKRLPEEIHACETTCSNDGLQAPALAYEVCVCASTSSCFCLFFPSFFVAFSLWWMFACVRLCVCEGHFFFFPVLVACLSTISQIL